MAIRLDIDGIKKVKETIQKMGGRVWVGDQKQFTKRIPLDYLSVVDDNGYPRLKFMHVLANSYIKELRPNEKQINEIVKLFNQQYS